MSTYLAKPGEIGRAWHVIDGDGVVLGRLATRVAALLRGKHKPQFTPSVDTGDFVVVVNAAKIRLTGRKLQQKVHFTHSGYPGGARFVHYDRLMVDHPERAVQYAVRGMLPKTKMGDRLITKLKVYRDHQHPHGAQRPAKAVL